MPHSDGRTGGRSVADGNKELFCSCTADFLWVALPAIAAVIWLQPFPLRLCQRTPCRAGAPPCQTAPKCQSLRGPFLTRGVSVGNTANPPSSKALTFYRATMELLWGGLGGDIYYFISSQRGGACVCWRLVRGSLTSSTPPSTAAWTSLTLSNRKCCRMLNLGV